MEPVVNGLEEEFDAQIEFQQINANSAEGRTIFESFGLRGHPAYIILNSQSEILWRGLGEQTYETLQTNIKNTLGNQ
jgi:hypothetical protein